MKALVYHGPGQRAWEDVPDPTIQAADGRHRANRLLHDLRHRSPHPEGGRAGGDRRARSSATRQSARSSRSEKAVTTLEPGDRVLVSCITSCGRCRFCKEGRYGLCTGGGGWIFGHLIDGLQAELARVPFADTSVYKVPDGLTRRAGPVPRRHPPDRVRGRRPQRRRRAGRHGRRRRSRPDRARGRS